MKTTVQGKMTNLLTIMNPRGCPLTFLNVFTFFSTFKFNFGLSGERDLSILSFKLQVLFIAGKDCLFSCQSFVIFIIAVWYAFCSYKSIILVIQQISKT